MLVEPSYRGHRIQVEAVDAGGRWDAEVRIRRLFTEEPARVEKVTCGKPDRQLAERWGAIWAKRWVDLRQAEEAAHAADDATQRRPG